MKWSKLKHLIEERITPKLQGRISINSTRYGNCTCGHAWLTLDKKVVANFCTRAYFNRTTLEFDAEKGKFIPGDIPSGINRMYKNLPVEYGEMTRQDVYEACWDFIHHLSIQEALNSEDCLIQTLAVLDSRLGKRGLQKVDYSQLHPLAKLMYEERLSAEGIPLNLTREPQNIP